MSNTKTLERIAHKNSYAIGENEVKKFIVYNKHGVIVEHKSGFFCSQYTGRFEMPKLEQLNFVRRQEFNTSRIENFYVKSVVYIHEAFAKSMLDFENLGEEVAIDGEYETFYSTFYRLEGIRVSDGVYTKRVTNEEGERRRERIDRANDLLLDNHIDLTRVEIEKLLNLAEQLKTISE